MNSFNSSVHSGLGRNLISNRLAKLIGVFVGLASITTWASAEIYPRRAVRVVHPVRVDAGFNALKDEQLVREALNLSRRYQFRAATYKLRLVKIDVQNLRRDSDLDRLLDALNISIEKLNDYYLSDYEKIEIMEDCGSVAIDALRNLAYKYGRGGFERPGTLSNLRDVIRLSREMVRITKDGRYRRAARKMRRGSRFLRQRYPRAPILAEVAEIMDMVAEKMMDYGLSHGEKVDLARDCSRSIIQKIRSSRRFKRENGGIGGGRYSGIDLGVMGGFQPNRMTSRSVLVGRDVGAIQNLTLRAVGGGLRIQNIVIELEGGRARNFQSLVLREGESQTLTLLGRRGLAKRIRRITVVGASDRFGLRTTQLQFTGQM